MNLHEHQAKELLSRFGIRAPRGGVAATAQEAERTTTELGGSAWVVKAQILAGDRGRAGGVLMAASPAEAARMADRLLGSRLVTPQTGEGGEIVTRVYVEQRCNALRELYLAMLIDRNAAGIVLVACAEGGTDIEQVAVESPAAILRIAVDIDKGLDDSDIDTVASKLGLQASQRSSLATILNGIHKAFVSLDASMIEINPLVVDSDGGLVALDVKMTVDDNALSRHSELKQIREQDDDDPDRLERERHGFNFIRLGGDIGCVVTGAGLALATMDLIKTHGGEPANFLDLPPVATRQQAAAACRRMLSDERIRVILINAFGGGMTRCDVIAEGFVTALRRQSLKVPLVVRFAGSSAEMGLHMLRNAGVAFESAQSLGDAARIAVAAARSERH